MAFKSIAKHNVGTSLSTLYTVPLSTSTIMIGLDIANIQTVGITASVVIQKNGGDTINYVKDAPIQPGSTLQVISGQKVVLEAQDIIKVSCSTINGADALISILEGA